MANGAGWSDQLTHLNKTLADLYPGVEDSRRVVTLAGLPARSIRFNNAAILNWFNILEEALRRGRVQPLVNVALVDFPEDPVLSSAVQRDATAAGAVGPPGPATNPATPSAPMPAPGLAYEPLLRVTQVATSISHLLTAAEEPLVTCLVRNAGPAPRRLRFGTRIERLSDPAVDLMSIPAGGEHDFRLLPRLIPNQIAGISDTTRATVTTRLEDVDSDDVLYERGSDIWILPKGVAPLDQRDPVTGELKDMTPYLGAFVTPRKREVTDLLRTVASSLPEGVSLSGYAGNDQWVQAQVKATFVTLKDLNILYVNTVLAHSPDSAWLNQLVQLPRETLASRRANCVEGMVLVASLLEAIGLNPALVFVEKHAFIGWETWPGSGTWQYLETTKIKDQTFEEAWESGMGEAAAFQRAAAKNPRMFRRWDMRTLRARGIVALE